MATTRFTRRLIALKTTPLWAIAVLACVGLVAFEEPAAHASHCDHIRAQLRSVEQAYSVYAQSAPPRATREWVAQGAVLRKQMVDLAAQLRACAATPHPTAANTSIPAPSPSPARVPPPPTTTLIPSTSAPAPTVTTTQGAATPSDSALDALARQLPAGSPIRQARERGASWQAIALAAGLTVAVLFAIMAVELFGPSVISRMGFLNALRFGRFGSKTATTGGLRKYDIIGSTKPFRSKNSKLVERNIEVKGGEQKAREMFRDLTGREATGAEKQEVGKVGQTVKFRQRGESGHPKVEVHTTSREKELRRGYPGAKVKFTFKD